MSQANELSQDATSVYQGMDDDMPFLQREDDKKPGMMEVSGAEYDSASSSFVYDPSTIQLSMSSSFAFSPRVAVAQYTGEYFCPSPIQKWSARKPAKTIRKSQPGKRKPCNCTRSQCLKLYCDCFANGEFCLNCNCRDCHNNLEYNHERSRAIKQSLEKNPSAFKPKIGVATKGFSADMERLHQKGCHCKKSNCLKNYCECYEAKVACTERCKCRTCRNTEADRQVRFSERFPIGGEFDRKSPGTDDEIEEPNTIKSVKTHPWYYLTDDVVETTTMCLLGQAHECEQRNESSTEIIKALCTEFGSCLNQIFDATRKATENEILAAKKDFVNPADHLD